jgi:hypothetical protein
MDGVIFLAIAGACVMSWLKYRHQRQMKEIEAKPGGADPQTVQQLHAATQQVHVLTADKTQLEERVRNLETIVCNVDFELNAKLNRLASRQLQATVMSPGGVEHAETEAFSVSGIEPGAHVAGRFVVEEQLGAGGMGAVYRARDEQLGETVALKVIAGAGLLDPAAADRFRREASAARRISHANIVRIHDIGEEHGMLFLSMEYISGTSLAALIQRHGTLPFAQLRTIVSQICKGMQAAHEAGVVHRDLKPGNILIDEAQQVKIIDFGLARQPHLEGMTATGMILGTPEYMAPEQIRGRAVDPRTDIYALGAVMYHAMVGHPPFRGDSPISVGFAHCNEELDPPNAVKPDIPPAWSQLVVTAMAKDPSQRFDSADDLADALPPA